VDLELVCGFCDSSVTVHSVTSGEKILISILQRFCNAHSACGFVTPLGQDDSDELSKTANIPVGRVSKRKLRLRDLPVEDEDEDEDE
jgi:hypothetical protein